MKKIIGGKVYDTDTAKELGSWSNMADVRDFHQFSETLYRKKTGEYFLHGSGGPLTQYAQTVGTNSWTGGERIMPLSYAEAQKWAEEKLSGDEYEAIFGEVAEDESRMQVLYSLSAATAETIKRRAAEQGISASAYVERLVQAAEAK